MVGGGEHLPQQRPGHRASDGDVDVRGEPPLGFDGAEILHLVAEDAAQVLDEPVEQGGEVQRVPGGPLVVIRLRIDRGAVVADLAVAVTGQGEEHGRPVALAVRRGEHPAGGAVLDLAARQVGGVLAAPGGPGPPARLRLPVLSAVASGDGAADARLGDFGVQLADELIQVTGALARRVGFIPLAWASARKVSQYSCISSGAAGPRSGSSSRCQPSRHWEMRSDLARSAHGGHRLTSVAPQGIMMVSDWPLTVSVRRSCTGRRHPPQASAIFRIESRASGIAIRSARVEVVVIRSPRFRGRRSRCPTSRRAGSPG